MYSYLLKSYKQYFGAYKIGIIVVDAILLFSKSSYNDYIHTYIHMYIMMSTIRVYAN